MVCNQFSQNGMIHLPFQENISEKAFITHSWCSKALQKKLHFTTGPPDGNSVLISSPIKNETQGCHSLHVGGNFDLQLYLASNTVDVRLKDGKKLSSENM